MIRKHSYQDMITKFTSDDLLGYLSQSMASINYLLKLIQFCKEFEDGDLDDFTFFTEVEDLGTIDTAVRDRAAYALIPENSVVAKYFRETVDMNVRLNANLQTIIRSGCFFSDEEVAEIDKVAREIVSGITHTIAYDFGIVEYEYERDGGDPDPDVDEILYSYCKSVNRSVADVASSIFDVFLEFRLKLHWFEAHPELEERFSNVMGPYLVGVPEELLDLKMVKAVTEGEMSPLDLLEKLNVEDE